MKYAVLALVLLMVGCQFFHEDYDPSYPGSELDAYLDSHTLATVIECGQMVRYNVRYLDDLIHDKNEYWQSPDQTWAWNRGDCEDYALLWMYVVHHELGFYPELVVGDVYDAGIWYRHGWVFCDGEYYEPQSGMNVTNNWAYLPDYLIGYGRAMWRSENPHRSVVE